MAKPSNGLGSCLRCSILFDLFCIGVSFWIVCCYMLQDGMIGLDEFVSGCMLLHGPAKSLQLAKMSFENKSPDASVSEGAFKGCLWLLGPEAK